MQIRRELYLKKTRILAVIIDKRNGIGHKNEFSDVYKYIFMKKYLAKSSDTSDNMAANI